MRVLVTGATGFIGRWVSSLLTFAGADLWLVARDADRLLEVSNSLGISGRRIALDLARPGLESLVSEARPAITFHCAAYGVDPAERDEAIAFAINERVVRQLAEAISERTVPDWPGLSMVHTGSFFELGAIEGTVTEESEAHPETAYGRSKLAGTLALAAVSERTRLRAVTARIFTAYGPGEHRARLLPSLRACARSGEALDLTGGTQALDFVFASDVAEALLRLGLSVEVPDRLVNLGSGRATTVREFVHTACEILGLDESLIRFGALPARSHEPKSLGADVRKLERIIRWVPSTTVAAGIRETIRLDPVGSA